MIKAYLTGFFTNTVTSLDDTLAHIPIVAYVTHTKKGKLAFGIGMIIAVSIVIALSAVLASFIEKLSFYRYIVSGLMLALAGVIYFDMFNNKEEKAKKKIQNIKKIKSISGKRFLKLIALGFIAAFTTIIDDTIAYSSILAGHEKLFVALGIISVTFLEIGIIFKFSRKINQFRYKKEISSGGLVLIALLVLFGII